MTAVLHAAVDVDADVTVQVYSDCFTGVLPEL